MAEVAITGRVPEVEHAEPPSRRDRGTSLIEILVAIVLLGGAVGAMLTTLRVTVSASSLQRDHANAYAWLQTAADVLYGAEREDCGTTTTSRQAAVVARYQQIVSGTENPENWPAQNIEVLPPVYFWDGTRYQLTCYDDQGINLQLVTLQVRNLDGRIIERIQVVKG
jgi:Tfp pilus assembly protein PilV